MEIVIMRILNYLYLLIIFFSIWVGLYHTKGLCRWQLIAGSKTELENNLPWNSVLEEKGTKISKSETKVSVISGTRADIKMSIERTMMQQVRVFQHLGSVSDTLG